MKEKRCSNCKALLFEINGRTVIKAVKGMTLHFVPSGTMKVKCRCGTTNYHVNSYKPSGAEALCIAE